MKTIKIFTISILVALSMNLSAQLKVLNTGNVYLPSGKSYWIGSSSDNGYRLRLHQSSSSAYIDYYSTLYIRTGSTGISRNTMTLANNGSVSIDATGIQDWWSGLNVKVATQYSCAYNLKNNYYGGSDVFYVRGDGYVWTRNGFLTSSDKNFKTDISNITSSLDKIKKLDGVKYKRKYNVSTGNSDSLDTKNVVEKVDDRFEYGLIAQDVEKIIPEVVHDMHDGSKAVSYTEIIPFLIEAIKEQQLEIEELKSSGKGNDSKLKSATVSSGSITDETLNSEAILYQNVPNPFTENTEIKYYLPEDVSSATLYIYNMQGNQIKNIPLHNTGDASEIIYGSELQAGMYIYALIADGKEIASKRMILTD